MCMYVCVVGVRVHVCVCASSVCMCLCAASISIEPLVLSSDCDLVHDCNFVLF